MSMKQDVFSDDLNKLADGSYKKDEHLLNLVISLKKYGADRQITKPEHFAGLLFLVTGIMNVEAEEFYDVLNAILASRMKRILGFDPEMIVALAEQQMSGKTKKDMN